MKKIWSSILYSGSGKYSNSADIRAIVLCNRINILIIISMLITLVVLRIHGMISNRPPGIASLKVLLMVIASAINLFLTKHYFNLLSKFLTAVLPSFIFLYFPLFFNYIEEDSFLIYPFTAIAASIVPLLIFSYQHEKGIYLLALTYCFSSVAFSDLVLIMMCPDTIHLKSVIINNYLFYKLAVIIAFIFINMSIVYLKKLNYNSELKLELNNNELKVALNDLSKAQNHLIQSEKMASVGILSAGVAHEINNPINFIYSGIQSLEENYNHLSKFMNESINIVNNKLSEQEKEKIDLLKEKYFIEDSLIFIPQLIENIKTGSERAEEIVKSLRYFASFEDEALAYIDLNATIEQAIEIFKIKNEGKILFRKNFEPGLKPIKCYSGLIKQLITNLISNSIDAIEKCGIITFKSSFVDLQKVTDPDLFGEYIKFEIEDTGTGIKIESLDDIFLPFFTTKDAGKGTGLGLYICHNIVQKHDGKIIVSSEPDKGTRFTIYIPANL